MTHFNPTEPPIHWTKCDASGPLALVVIILFLGTLALWADFVSSFVEF